MVSGRFEIYGKKNTIETGEKSLRDMFIRLVEIYPCLELIQTAIKKSPRDLWPSNDFKNNIVVKMELWDLKTRTWGKKNKFLWLPWLYS